MKIDCSFSERDHIVDEAMKIFTKIAKNSFQTFRWMFDRNIENKLSLLEVTKFSLG